MAQVVNTSRKFICKALRINDVKLAMINDLLSSICTPMRCVALTINAATTGVMQINKGRRVLAP